MNTHAQYVNTAIRWIQVTDKKIATLIYSRTCGYFAPVAQMNRGKIEEFHERKYINIDKALQMDKRDQAWRGAVTPHRLSATMPV